MRLRCGTAVCDVYPALGGSIGRWSIGDQAMLRTASAAAIAQGNMLGMASFPLVPYSNRIGHAQFAWGGETITLARNFPPEPHAIHGLGWQRAWLVTAQQEDRLTLTLQCAAGPDWPWPFSAEQQIILGADRLTLRLSATNEADRPVPLAFGHHPYFDADGATLAFFADRVWMTGDDALPTIAVEPANAFDFAGGAPVQGRAIDHCYAGVTEPAQIGWSGRPLALAVTSDLPAAIVYIPHHGDAFCVEPVPHINNALNLPGHTPAMPVIAPGETFETVIIFEAQRP